MRPKPTGSWRPASTPARCCSSSNNGVPGRPATLAPAPRHAASGSGGNAAAQELAGEDPERLNAVPPRDLLALLARAGAVADRHLERAQPAAQQLAGDLRLHAEPSGFNPQRAVEAHRHQLE